MDRASASCLDASDIACRRHGGVKQLFDPDDTRLLVRDLIDPRDMDVVLGCGRRGLRAVSRTGRGAAHNRGTSARPPLRGIRAGRVAPLVHQCQGAGSAHRRRSNPQLPEPVDRSDMTHLRALRIAPDPDAASIPKRGPSGCRPSAGIAAWRSANYSGWNTAMVLPSGSLNQAERPMPGVVTT